MDEFVVGFAFNETMDLILLVEKLRPLWQKGLLNGVGGKIEKSESPYDAMCRECKEETGLTLNWICRGVMQGKNDDNHTFRCHIFYAYSQEIVKAKQIEDEPLRIYNLQRLDFGRVVENLNFLIPFGMCKNRTVFMSLLY